MCLCVCTVRDTAEHSRSRTAVGEAVSTLHGHQRASVNTGGNGLRLATSQLRVGTANGVLMNRSIVSPASVTNCHRWDQLSSDIADDMNAEKLPIVPTKDQLHKPSLLLPDG